MVLRDARYCASVSWYAMRVTDIPYAATRFLHKQRYGARVCCYAPGTKEAVLSWRMGDMRYCIVLSWRMVLRAWYKRSGTELACGGTRSRRVHR
eukprot:2436143-Rhodomonas_salina.1